MCSDAFFLSPDGLDRRRAEAGPPRHRPGVGPRRRVLSVRDRGGGMLTDTAARCRMPGVTVTGNPGFLPTGRWLRLGSVDAVVGCQSPTSPRWFQSRLR